MSGISKNQHELMKSMHYVSNFGKETGIPYFGTGYWESLGYMLGFPEDDRPQKSNHDMELTLENRTQLNAIRKIYIRYLLSDCHRIIRENYILDEYSLKFVLSNNKLKPVIDHFKKQLNGNKD